MGVMDYCRAEQSPIGYVCNRPSGHSGVHVARAGDRVCARWADAPDDDRPAVWLDGGIAVPAWVADWIAVDRG